MSMTEAYSLTIYNAPLTDLSAPSTKSPAMKLSNEAIWKMYKEQIALHWKADEIFCAKNEDVFLNFIKKIFGPVAPSDWRALKN